MPSLLTIYQGRSADRNPHGLSGAAALGEAMGRRLGVAQTTLGSGAHVPATGWADDLRGACEDLQALADDLDQRLAAGTRPLSVLPRCAAALATLPVVLRHHPEAWVVWFDAHADLNTPETSPSGYLGGMVLAAAAGLWHSGFGAGLPLPRLALVGVRDVDPAERALIDTSGLASVRADSQVGATLRRLVAGRPLYVHVDVDVLAPGLLPTEIAVPGGLSWSDLHAACGALTAGTVVGVEIAELEAPAGVDAADGIARLLAATSPLLDALAPPASGDNRR